MSVAQKAILSINGSKADFMFETTKHMVGQKIIVTFNDSKGSFQLSLPHMSMVETLNGTRLQ